MDKTQSSNEFDPIPNMPDLVGHFMTGGKVPKSSFRKTKWIRLADIRDEDKLISDFKSLPKFPSFITADYLEQHSEYKEHSILIVFWLIDRIAKKFNPFPTAAIPLSNELWMKKTRCRDARESDAVNLCLFAALFLTGSIRGSATILASSNKRTMRYGTEKCSLMRELLKTSSDFPSILDTHSINTQSVSTFCSDFQFHSNISQLLSSSNDHPPISTTDSFSNSFISETSSSITTKSVLSLSFSPKESHSLSISSTAAEISVSVIPIPHLSSESISDITFSSIPNSKAKFASHSMALIDHYDYTFPNSIRVNGIWMGPSAQMLRVGRRRVRITNFNDNDDEDMSTRHRPRLNLPDS